MKYIVVEYFYSKTNQMHNISNLFYFGTTLYILDFKLSPCSEFCMLSYGELPRRNHTTSFLMGNYPEESTQQHSTSFGRILRTKHVVPK
jgi:hypothetical protein